MTELVRELALGALEVAAFLVGESFEDFRRHGMVPAQGDKGHIAHGIALNPEALFTDQTVEVLLGLPNLLFVLLTQLTLLFFEDFLAKRLGQGLSYVRQKAFHIVLQPASLTGFQRNGLRLVGIPEMMNVHPVTRGRQSGVTLA